MGTLCPYCHIEVSESSIEAEDGCCPECGSVITPASSIFEDEMLDDDDIDIGHDSDVEDDFDDFEDDDFDDEGFDDFDDDLTDGLDDDNDDFEDDDDDDDFDR
jgi:hypothetical protein